LANVEHKDIPDSGLHEPKGAASATVGTVYTSDGLGSGTHQLPEIEGQASASAGKVPYKAAGGNVVWDLPRSDNHARMSVINNMTTISKTAGSADLHLEADYTKVSLFVDGPLGGVDLTLSGDSTFIINTDGTYVLALWASVSSDTVSTLIALTPRINGVSDAPNSPVAKQLIKDVGGITTVSGFGFNTFSAGDVIDLGLAANKNSNINIHESVLHVLRLA
jgi:hypothetical protein